MYQRVPDGALARASYWSMYHRRGIQYMQCIVNSLANLCMHLYTSSHIIVVLINCELVHELERRDSHFCTLWTFLEASC
jgi:hypothetical protein